MDKISLGERIRDARKGAGLTQADLADKLDIALPTLSKYEKGHRSPDALLLSRMVKILECDPVWLLMGSQSTSEKFTFEEWEWINRMINVLRNPNTSQVIKESLTAFEKVPGGEEIEEEEIKPLKKIL